MKECTLPLKAAFCLKCNGRLFSVFSPMKNQLQPGIVHRGIKNNNNKKTNKQQYIDQPSAETIIPKPLCRSLLSRCLHYAASKLVFVAIVHENVTLTHVCQ